MTIPPLFFTRRTSLEGQTQLNANFKNAAGPSVLDAWTHGDLLTVHMEEMIHPEWNTLPIEQNGTGKLAFQTEQKLTSPARAA